MPGKACAGAWDKKFRELLRYQRKSGDCNVPNRYAPNPSLGRWVLRQRAHKKRGELLPDRERRLEEAGFVFELKKIRNTQNWHARLQDAQRYFDKHRRWPPRSCPELGCWIHNQRESYRTGNLSDERTDLLEKAGFQWAGRKTGFAAKEETVDDCSANANGPQPPGAVGEGESDPTHASNSSGVKQGTGQVHQEPVEERKDQDPAELRRLKKLVHSQEGTIEALKRKVRELEKEKQEYFAQAKRLEELAGGPEVLVMAENQERGRTPGSICETKAIDEAGNGRARGSVSPRAMARALRLRWCVAPARPPRGTAGQRALHVDKRRKLRATDSI